MRKVRIDLSGFFTNRGLQPPGTTGDYGFNIWSNTFPAEELPPAGTVADVAGVPFSFPPDAATGDNIRCRGQVIALPAGDWDWIYLIGAAERRTEDQVELRYRDGSVRPAWLRMSDFWPETPVRFGEPLAFRTRSMRYPRHTHQNHAPALWQQRIGIAEPGNLSAVRLPDNPAMHVFALTLVADEEARCAR
ncbi:hypothetical protein [Winogradskya humida]|uniref:Uncharacterized protein n=1 Tax=Winogradskya humida TaxID=113566 RepID=A0ABQ4A2C3_9ACTN|nr:hypothetical protein [Actinoplanes humidus]GIE25005.1 hypothetical protein Ahu01nite_081070 [Actinoplanes humidus]